MELPNPSLPPAQAHTLVGPAPMPEPAPLVRPRPGARARMALLVLFALIGTGIWFGVRGDVSAETVMAQHAELIAWRDTHGIMAVAGFFAVTAFAALLSLPGIAVFTLAGGVLFGVMWGTLLVVAAATLGAMGLYLLARAGFGDGLMRRMERGRTAWLAEELRRNEIRALLFLRIAPVVPFLLANMLPALMGVRPMRYVVTTFFGLIPGTLAVAFAGYGLGEVAASGGASDLKLLAALFIGVPLVLVLLSFAPRLWRR
ncbi:MAG: TVP38/TMEM64 family protein [Alkalilacustris sp.]